MIILLCYYCTMWRLLPYARYGWNHISFYGQSARNFLELKGVQIGDESPENWCFFLDIDLEEEIAKWILTQHLVTWKPNTTRRWPLWYNPKFPLHYVFGNPSQTYVMIIDSTSPPNSFCAKTPLSKDMWIMTQKFKCLQKTQKFLRALNIL